MEGSSFELADAAEAPAGDGGLKDALVLDRVLGLEFSEKCLE
jgi:hypothetical protein